MRTLKKTLSLVLVLAMVCSFFVMGTSAAFEDAADIDAKYAEAVEVMSGLGIIEGMGNGNFNPKGTLTRAQAAAFIVKMTQAQDYAAGCTTTFEDVPAGAWYYDEIAYCETMGYMNGYGNGKVGPNDTLKPVDFALLLMRVAGVDTTSVKSYPLDAYTLAVKEGFASATEIMAASVTRELAAQMAFHGLKKDGTGAKGYIVDGITDVVFDDYITAFVASGSDAEKVHPAPAQGSLYVTKFSVATVTGTVISTPATVANQAYSEIKTATATVKVLADLGSDMVGHNVTVYYKNETAKAATGYTVYAVIDRTSSFTLTGLETAAQVKAAFAAINVTADVEDIPVITNGAIGTTGAGIANYDVDNGTLKDETSPDPVAVGACEVLYTTAGVIGIKVADTVIAGYVNDVVTTANAEAIKINVGATVLNNKATDDVVNEYEGIAKNDVIVYTVTGNIYNLAKAATVEGKIEKKDGTKLTIGGVEYSAFTGTDNSNITGDLWNGTTLSPVDFKTNYTLYLTADNQYFAVVSETAAAAVKSDIVMVLDTFAEATYDAYGTPLTKTYAQYIDLNGVEGKVLVGVNAANDTYNKLVGVNDLSAGFYTFETDTDLDSLSATLGFKKAVEAPVAYNATTAPVFVEALAADTELTVNSTSVTYGTDSKAYLTASTKYIFVEGTLGELEVEVVTGGINTEVEAANSSLILSKDADGNTIVDVVIIEGAYTNAGLNATDYIYVADAQATPVELPDAEGNTVYQYTVYNAVTGEQMTIVATNTTIAAAGFYSYKVTDGIYTLGSKVTEAAAPAAGAYYDEAYTSKFGTKVTTSQMTDVEAGAAIIVDTRLASEMTTVSEITTLDGINALALATPAVPVTFDCLVGANGVTIIFIHTVG